MQKFKADLYIKMLTTRGHFLFIKSTKTKQQTTKIKYPTAK